MRAQRDSCTVCGDIAQPEYQHFTSEHTPEQVRRFIGTLMWAPEGDLPTVMTELIVNDELYARLTEDDINHDTVREQAGEDA